MGDDHDFPLMKEVYHSVSYSEARRPEFVQPVTKILRLWAPELMPQCFKSFKSHVALESSLWCKVYQPVQERHGSICLSEQEQAHLTQART